MEEVPDEDHHPSSNIPPRNPDRILEHVSDDNHDDGVSKPRLSKPSKRRRVDSDVDDQDDSQAMGSTSAKKHKPVTQEPGSSAEAPVIVDETPETPDEEIGMCMSVEEIRTHQSIRAPVKGLDITSLRILQASTYP